MKLVCFTKCKTLHREECALDFGSIVEGNLYLTLKFTGDPKIYIMYFINAVDVGKSEDLNIVQVQDVHNCRFLVATFLEMKNVDRKHSYSS